ncbi:MAG: S8 family serine peptidase [Verrucomicrobia bacterium]|nr:S8 family serine peptidase [Verrucomicrobiota bacterium]MCF7707932.1 S8 family serine peptidase [Verrucomicrobiota bacterium]
MKSSNYFTYGLSTGLPRPVIIMLRLFLATGVIASLLLSAISIDAEIEWDNDAEEVNADIHGWRLKEVLAEIVENTGWRILVEPGTERVVSAKFKDLSINDALKRLLGGLNYAIISDTGEPVKMHVFKTDMRRATIKISVTDAQNKKAPDSGRVPDELVVSLKSGDASIDEIAEKAGAKVVGESDDLRAYRLKFESEEAAQRARDLLDEIDDVENVESNYYVQRPDLMQPLTWGKSLPLTVIAGDAEGADGPVIGLIDTSVGGVREDMESFLLPAISIVNNDASDTVSPELTHGTAMFNTILQSLTVANPGTESGVRVLPVDVYGESETTTTFEVALGVSKAVGNGANILNLSLGSTEYSPLLQRVIGDAIDQDILVLAAAGNMGSNRDFFPAADPEVFAVTAAALDGGIEEYANTGEYIDAAAPGTTLVGFGGRTYLVSGTSVSSAWMSGWMSAYSDKEGISIKEAAEAAPGFFPPGRGD